MKEAKSLGICIGATTLSAVEAVRDQDGKIKTEVVYTRPHQGNPRDSLLAALEKSRIDGAGKVVVTGRKFRHAVNLSSISEPEAVESALVYSNGRGERPDAVISAGGESFLVYVLGKDGKISSVRTGNKCASGTGEFFMQQLGRIGLSPEDAVRFARKEKPYRVSGRCSVFCKSDCTHALNKGIEKGRIAAGLCEMMAGKIIEIVKQIPKGDVMLIGGTSRNGVLVDCLKKEFGRLRVPSESAYFEALGSALWALDHETKPFPEKENLFCRNTHSFMPLQPIARYKPLVSFKTMERGFVRSGDRCIIGLDVGSTTTKAILLRADDDKISASVYLRTQGDPVSASRRCYEELLNRVGAPEDRIKIIGLGVTGSGRQIAGLHGMTVGVINEIIAHATAALFFDPTVDTIFEIGGQDAKYTFIKNGVPSDYAMNDACSAGTGSFLEEAAKETMGLEMEQIGDIALRGSRPPNFNDQCAAFIGSDIKTAFHEGVTKDDIVAGLVYSVCMNYNNRVKGNRPVGNNVFMQGGVCYNSAVPTAMAAVTGKRIVVPPEPGLMGAFGVALEVKRRIKLGLLAEGVFSLRTLKDRNLERDGFFICNGGKEGCDRKCEITRIRMEGKSYPFGGACNRWYNQRFGISSDTAGFNLVRIHEDLVFRRHSSLPFTGEAAERTADGRRTVGINKSFMTDSYFPLYRQFFSELGFGIVLPDHPAPDGLDRKLAPFCYPAEVSHGFLADLLEKKTDYLFLPQVKSTAMEQDGKRTVTCPICQGEPYYLASAFKDHREFRRLSENERILTPVIDFAKGEKAVTGVLVETARAMGCSRKQARCAVVGALRSQRRITAARKDAGNLLLEALGENPTRFGIALFGRSYNAFVSESNMGIPDKFASRGVAVAPFDFFPIGNEPVRDGMYWSSGREILKGAAFVKKHPQLYACYITNFSCGPDSFILEYFRDMMGEKPYLILELDSHVADAGLETRIEAFLDIIRNYREMPDGAQPFRIGAAVKQAYYDYGKKVVVDSQGREHALDHPRVRLVFPSMGPYLSGATAAVFRSLGVRATALPPADEEVLKLGRGNTSCKECLPLLLTVGTLLKRLEERSRKDELLVYFMPSASGPCRFGQYLPYISRLLASREVENVALFSLQAENSYTKHLENDLTLKLWWCIVISDIMQDIYSVLLTNARNKNDAMEIFRRQWDNILRVLEHKPRFRDLKAVLREAARELKTIAPTRTLEDTPSVLITGEIFVRHDGLSRQFLVERLAEKGVAAKVSGVAEWIYYTDWCFKKGLSGADPDFKTLVNLFLRKTRMKNDERTLKKIMAQSGLFYCRMENVDRIVANVRHLINPELIGEAVLTVGGAVTEVPEHYCGVIAIGPFGCMPNRISEAILTTGMGHDRGGSTRGLNRKMKKRHDVVPEFPFLAVESDGNPFPQIITAKLEVFLMQAVRIHGIMKNRKYAEGNHSDCD
jgi:predicted CoA-substrate-specific enzyme activase